MARWLHKRGRIWHYRFVVGGREYTGSTEATDLETAKTVLEIVRRDTVLGEHGIRKAPTLKAVADAWLETAGRAKSAAHRRSAEQSLDALAELHRLPLTHITQSRFDSWRAGYLASHSEATTNLVARYLKLWLRWALSDRLIKEMPCTIKQPRPQERERPIVELPEMGDFLAKVDGAHRNAQVPAAVRFAMMLGLRENEVLGARWENIRDGFYVVSPKATGRGRTKSGKIRQVAIPEELRQALVHMLAEQSMGPAQWPRLGLMFPGAKGKPHASTWLRQALRRGGIAGLGMHRLRATFATLHLSSGTDIKTVQEMLGHADPRTTMIYQETTMEQKAERQAGLWRKA